MFKKNFSRLLRISLNTKKASIFSKCIAKISTSTLGRVSKGLINTNMMTYNFSKTPKTLKLGLLGLGRAGNFHMNSIEALSGVELKWAMDIKKHLAVDYSKRMKSNWTVELDDVLNDPEVDAVIIASPTDVHNY